MPTVVSIVIPCRNEEQYIAACVESVLAFDRPDDLDIEVLVIDGRSTDRTVAIVRSIAASAGVIRIIDNPNVSPPAAMNIGVRHARGRWVMRLDAHTEYPRDYLRACHEVALRTGADNVGGIVVTRPGASTYSAHLVQALTTHRFGVGDSAFRTGGLEGEVDTVPFGYFRRDVFDRVGVYDERLIRASDYELNRRIRAQGGRVYMSPAIRSSYHNQPSMVAFLRKQLVLEGPYNAYMWYLAPGAFSLRHAVTAIFVLGLGGGLLLGAAFRPAALLWLAVMALYAGLAVLASWQQALRYGRPDYIVVLPWCFLLFHVVHGFGVLCGLARIVTKTAPMQLARGRS
jgi:glycosyltransferase involved in cell wall biosynthesis